MGKFSEGSATLKYAREIDRARKLREAFAIEFDMKPFVDWRSSRVWKFCRMAAESPEQEKKIRRLLIELGIGHDRWSGAGGVFDHGEIWGFRGLPLVIVGHPYDFFGVSGNACRFLNELSQISCLKVGIDDRPSYYGFGTHHIRVENMKNYRLYNL